MKASPYEGDPSRGWTMETAMRLKQGGELPLVPRPALMGAIGDLHELFVKARQTPWQQIVFKVFITPEGPVGSSCSYAYEGDS